MPLNKRMLCIINNQRLAAFNFPKRSIAYRKARCSRLALPALTGTIRKVFGVFQPLEGVNSFSSLRILIILKSENVALARPIVLLRFFQTIHPHKYQSDPYQISLAVLAVICQHILLSVLRELQCLLNKQ